LWNQHRLSFSHHLQLFKLPFHTAGRENARYELWHKRNKNYKNVALRGRRKVEVEEEAKGDIKEDMFLRHSLQARQDKKR